MVLSPPSKTILYLQLSSFQTQYTIYSTLSSHNHPQQKRIIFGVSKIMDLTVSSIVEGLSFSDWPFCWELCSFYESKIIKKPLYLFSIHQTVIMGNACEICEQKTTETPFTPYSQRTYTQSENKNLYIKNTPDTSNQLGLGDAPNPNNVSPTTLPALSPIIKEILNHETSIKPFQAETVRGTKFPPFELKKLKKCYDGEWKNGILHGKGKAYYDNGTYFQGYFKNGVADCDDGIIIYPDGTYYRGQVRNSKSNGQGTLVYRDGEMRYTGQWLNDKPHGLGKQQYKNKSCYIGNFVNGQKSGNGQFKWPDGSKYKGQFIDGNMHGFGEHTASNGEVYKGTFVKNKKSGSGQQLSPLGTYKGEFSNDKKNGYGQFVFSDKRVFKGNFVDGYPQGQGTMMFPTGQVISGVWRNGEIQSIEGNSKVINGGVQPNVGQRENWSSVNHSGKFN